MIRVSPVPGKYEASQPTGPTTKAKLHFTFPRCQRAFFKESHTLPTFYFNCKLKTPSIRTSVATASYLFMWHSQPTRRGQRLVAGLGLRLGLRFFAVKKKYRKPVLLLLDHNLSSDEWPFNRGLFNHQKLTAPNRHLKRVRHSGYITQGAAFYLVLFTQYIY